MVKYKLALEIIPKWGLALLFGSCLTFFALFISFGVWGPAEFTLSPNRPALDDSTWNQFLNGELTLEGSQTGLQPLNTELYFWLRFSKKDNIPSGFEKKITFNITIWKVGSGQFGSPTFLSKGGSHTRKLICPEKEEHCAPLLIFYLPTLISATYLLKFSIVPDSKDIRWRKLLSQTLDVGMTYVDEKYSFFEIIFRYGFLGLGLAFLVGFIIITFCKQPSLKDWHSEQKWIVLLLFSLIFFNNPLFVLHFYLNSWFWPLINIVFRLTFISILLMTLLVVTHAVYKTESERTFGSFYLPKIGVVVSLWVVTCFALLWNSYKNHLDPVYSIAEDAQIYKYVIYMSIMIIMIYIAMLLYYIFRGLFLYRSLPQKFSQKLVIVWGVTITTVVISYAVLLGLSIAGLMRVAVIFLTYQTVFNIYTYVLAILFLPTNTKEVVTDYELEKEKMISGN